MKGRFKRLCLVSPAGATKKPTQLLVIAPAAVQVLGADNIKRKIFRLNCKYSVNAPCKNGNFSVLSEGGIRDDSQVLGADNLKPIIISS